MEKFSEEYLMEATGSEYKEAAKILTYKELFKKVTNADELKTMILENEKEADEVAGNNFELDEEREKSEIAILERVESPHSGFDFYIARRAVKGKIQDMETVLIARRRGRIYLAPLAGEEAEQYEAIDEKRFLNEDQRTILTRGGQTKTTFGEPVLLDLSGEEGGEAKITPLLYRAPGTLMPKSGILRTPKPPPIYPELLAEKNNKEIIGANILGRFINGAKEGEGAEYIAKPLGVLSEEPGGIIYEMARVPQYKGREKSITLLDAKLTAEQALTVLLHLFRGIDFLSRRGINHMDVKPDNVLLTKEGVKIIDFGLMRFDKDSVEEKFKHLTAGLPKKHTNIVFERSGLAWGTLPYAHMEYMMFGTEESQPFSRNYDIHAAALTVLDVMWQVVEKNNNVYFDEDLSYRTRGKDQQRMPMAYKNFIDNLRKKRKQLEGAFAHVVKNSALLKQFLDLIEKSFDIRFDQQEVAKTGIGANSPSAREFIKLLEEMGAKENLNYKNF